MTTKQKIQELLNKLAPNVEAQKTWLKLWTGKRLLSELDEAETDTVFIKLAKIEGGTEKKPNTDNQLSLDEPPAPKPKKTLATTPRPPAQAPADIVPIPSGEPTGQLAITSEESVDKLIAIMDRIKKFSKVKLQQINPKKMVRFGDTICLCGSAISEFITGLPLPIALENTKELDQERTPNGYPIYRFQADAINKLTGMSMPVYSEESAEKPFYSTRYKKGTREKYKLAPDQVNLRDVRTASYRGLWKETVKLFFGLRGMTSSEAKEIGIKVQNIKEVPFS